jgi:tellurite resistance protein
MYLMMVADRDANPLERDTLRGAMKTLVGDHLADAAIDWVMGEFEASLAREGAASRLQRIGVRLSADREDAESAFALAAAVAVADERVDAKEDQLLAEIAEWLGITAVRATSILEEVS